ncbi:MAG: hypothetical protein J6R18_03900 [Kiritimatiellae bacterium]|nr:hypothetical protein [Kiritimatiellia bacterium]
MKTIAFFLACTAALAGSAELSLNGSWEFRFEEGKSIAEVANPAFKSTDIMSVPGCYDMMPKWLCKRGTGLYRKTFILDEAVDNAWIVVDGMGLTGNFRIDGKDLGTHPYPYARLELETGPLAAGEHTVFAALDNRFDWTTQKLARPYYDFYCFGGFYHGVRLSFDNRKLFVRTRDYKTGTVEIEAVNFKQGDFDAELVFDSKNSLPVTFKNSRVKVDVPGFKLWSPQSPNLHTVSVKTETGRVSARFGIRSVEAKNGRIYLNGKPIYLKGANRHESHPTFGASTPESLMVLDIQNLKSIGGNFFRGAHYQQSQRFLDLCDEMGVLVWEESLGWGNGSARGSSGELSDPGFIAAQIHETREMVRASFNHPCVIVFAYMNEFNSVSKEGKSLSDKLIETIKAEDSGRLVSFACQHVKNDISNANTDLVSFNIYPGWIGSDAGDSENLRRLINAAVTNTVDRFRKLYPDKPIMVSEMGTCGVYGQRDPVAAQWTEEFQDEYNAAVIDSVFDEKEICGLAIWQFTDSKSYYRGGSTIRTKPFAQNLAGLFDAYRRPKITVETVKKKFARKAAGELR